MQPYCMKSGVLLHVNKRTHIRKTILIFTLIMEYLYNIVSEIFFMFMEMSPYLLLGFLLAGLMHEFVPADIYAKYLSGNNMRSVIYAALLGIPLPLCSCGVIPTAMGIRREGASKGATLSFLIATPQTGVDSIIATYSLMGLPFALVRPLAALATSVFGGALCNVVCKEDGQTVRNTQGDGGMASGKKSLWRRLCGVFHYAFSEMIEDIGKWLVIGLAIAGFITASVPDSWFVVFKDNTLYSILFVLLFSIPMYLCATGSIPIAVALMMKGLTPGAALVLLMAGPACSMASILVIDKVLGRKTLCVYLASISLGAIAFAYGIDYLLPAEWFIPMANKGAHHCDNVGTWVGYVCAAAFAVMLLKALNPFGKKKHRCHCHEAHGRCECGHAGQVHTYKVGGMTCNHCAANVAKALESVAGTEDVQVSLHDGTAKVRGAFSQKELQKAVESLGFTIEAQSQEQS